MASSPHPFSPTNMKNQIKTVLLPGGLPAIRGPVSLFSTHPPAAGRVRRLRGMTFARYAA